MDVTTSGYIVGILGLAVVFAPIILLAGLTYNRQFRGMKNGTEVLGKILKAEKVKEEYIRGAGMFYEHFPCKKGVCLTVYYDTENPDNCVTNYEVKESKEAFFVLLFVVPVALSVLAIIALVII